MHCMWPHDSYIHTLMKQEQEIGGGRGSAIYGAPQPLLMIMMIRVLRALLCDDDDDDDHVVQCMSE